MKTTILTLLVVLFALSSCNKYPDGPAFSLLSKKERLSNTWKIDQYFENGVNKTADANNVLKDYNLTIDKSGSYSLTYKLFSILSVSESGTWDFVSNNENVLFTKTSPSPVSTTEWSILKLKENELWGQYNDSSKVVKVQLIPY
jgi:hypothetical protein